MWFALSFLALLLVVNIGTALLKTGETIQYSDFKQRLAQGQIAEVTISKDTIRGKYIKPEGGEVAFSTIRVDDPKLVEQLDGQRVRFEGETQSVWIGELLSWVLPFILIIALWMFLFRRMGGAEGGIMSFARSPAKI